MTKVDPAARARQREAAHYADQDGGVGDKTATKADDHQDGRNHEGGYCQTPGLARRSAQPARDPVHSHPHQRNADKEHGRPGDERGEKRGKLAEKRGDEHAQNPGNDRSAKDARQAEGRVGGYGYAGGDRDEGDAHHDWQPHAHRTETNALNQGDKSAGHQIRADQIGGLVRPQTQGAGQNQGYCDRACIHGQHMLDCQDQQLWRRKHLVDRILRHDDFPKRHPLGSSAPIL